MCTQLSTPRPEPVSARSPVTTRSVAARPVRERQIRAQPVVAAAPRPPLPKREPRAPDYGTNASIAALVQSFEQATLPREQWTHTAHLVVALAYARRQRPSVAFARLRDAIQRYNQATGAVATATRGYHETITRAWFHLVRHFLDVFDDGRSLAALADALVGLYASKDVLFEHFSRERLLSAEARAGWVEPDVRALPELEVFTREDRVWLSALDGRAAALASNAPAKPVAPLALAVERELVTVAS